MLFVNIRENVTDFIMSYAGLLGSG